MLSNKIRKFLFPFLLFLCTVFTRFSFLNWGGGYFFNPDENNMARSVLQMSFSNLNPNFFAYGQFPLFLSFLTTPAHSFSAIVVDLRFWSAFFSSFSILFFYLIAKDIFQSKKIASIFALLLIFTPGLIQSAHFGTTESILIFVFSANVFSSLKYYQSSQKRFLFLSALVSAIGLASKVTAIFFITPIIISIFMVFLKEKKPLLFFGNAFIFSAVLLLLTFIFSPFSFIKFSDFRSSMIYETTVATGVNKVFYTRQFEGSIPYIFQLQKIFPYANGIFIFIFSFLGFLFFALNTKHLTLNTKYKLLILFIPSIFYFIYTGQLFVKWSRFMSPLFFVAPFFCLFIFRKINNTFLSSILLLILMIPGIYFFQRYFYADSRIIASDWIKNNISPDSLILSESGNVINLPLSSKNIVNNFDFYQLDSDPDFPKKLLQNIESAEYILIPSRRVFKNQNNSNYPISQKYYQNLFSGQFGFSQIKIFSLNKSFLLKDEDAEETWSVFDNPTIRIYKKGHANI